MDKNKIFSEELIIAAINASKEGAVDREYLEYLEQKREQKRKEQEEENKSSFRKLCDKIRSKRILRKLIKISLFVGSFILKGVLFAMGIDLFKTFFNLCDPIGEGIDIIYF